MVLPMGFMARRRMRFDTAPGAINNNARKGKRKDMPPVSYNDINPVSSATGEANRAPDVLQAVAGLALNVSTLNKIADELTERLAQVLLPPNAGKALVSSAESPQPVRTPLSNRIQTISDEANDALDKLRSILGRLEV